MKKQLSINMEIDTNIDSNENVKSLVLDLIETANNYFVAISDVRLDNEQIFSQNKALHLASTPEEAPAFSISIGIAGCSFTVNTEQLLLLRSMAASDQELLKVWASMDDTLRTAYKVAEESVQNILAESFESELHIENICGVSESVSFSLGGDLND